METASLCFDSPLLEHLSLWFSATIGWLTGRASSMWNYGCWFVGGDDLTGALHVL